ncbi:MAG: cysteine desulfurase [Lachnospiraceae bacterium]|jgi:cysteine desulfurase|nr:cysteine desulfurase [Lachnospiraceae bacterium]
MIYLDHAATTAVHPEVIREMEPYFGELYANPSGVYEFSEDAKEILQRVRQRIADSIGAESNEIYFTSGGTESDNWALVGAAEGMRNRGRHIITSCIEHHAILRACEYLETRGYDITYLPVDAEGRVSIEELERAIRPDTILISIMFANNEVGTVQPIQEIGAIAERNGILFHTDAVQAYLHEKIDVGKMGIGMLSASSHKFQGPKGVGFLYVRSGIDLPSFLHGGSQERGRRAGTENVAGIVGMGKAVAVGEREYQKNHEKMLSLREYLLHRLETEIPFCKINGSRKDRLDGNVNVSFRFLEGESLIILLDMEGICVSGGSACAASEHTVSHVLQGIGLPPEFSRGTIRISLGAENTIEEMEYVADKIKELVGNLREFSEEYLELQEKGFV